MKKWEYKEFVSIAQTPPPTKSLQQELNSVGEEGWELVGFRSREAGVVFYIFKRPLKK